MELHLQDVFEQTYLNRESVRVRLASRPLQCGPTLYLMVHTLLLLRPALWVLAQVDSGATALSDSAAFAVERRELPIVEHGDGAQRCHVPFANECRPVDELNTYNRVHPWVFFQNIFELGWSVFFVDNAKSKVFDRFVAAHVEAVLHDDVRRDFDRSCVPFD